MAACDLFGAAAAAGKFLLYQNFRSIYAFGMLDLRRIRLPRGVLLDTVQNYPGALPHTEGCTAVKGGFSLILYDKTVRSRVRRNWTIAHEAGHILLGHRTNGSREQAEADSFAAAFLLPEVLIRRLDSMRRAELTPQELTVWFSASLSACKTRRSELSSRPYYPLPSDEALLNLLSDSVFAEISGNDSL